MLSVRFSDDGELCIEAAPPLLVRLRNVRPRVTGKRADVPFDCRDARREPVRHPYGWECREHGLRVTLDVQCQAGGCVLRATVKNAASGALLLRDFSPLFLDAPDSLCVGAGVDRWSIFRNGYQSWSGTRTYRVTETDRDPAWGFLRIATVDLAHRSPERRGSFRSDLFTAIQNLRSREVLCIGFLGAAQAFGVVCVTAEPGQFPQLDASCDYEGKSLEPGESLASEPLWVAAGFEEQDLLERYAELLGRSMKARVPRRNPVGWCSWYYYFTHVTERHVVTNLERLVQLRDRFRLDYVQVDDGYQAAIGDWLESNGKFPHGMAWLAERIRSSGFEAGIWVAPFIAKPEAKLFRDHPAWFVRSERGDPRWALWNPAWGWRPAYALDTTNPEVLRWLRSLARTLVREWGYRILKLDFLFAAGLPGQRHDRHATRAEALRRGLEAVREGAGDEAFLLGCGCPLGPAIGVVDAMRIGPDVAPFWTNWLSRGPMRDLHGVATKHAVRNILTRAFMHGRLWLNDPDCLMVRASRTKLSLEETRSLAAVIGLTDGMLVLSDRMDQLAQERLAVIDTSMMLRGGTTTVLDLFEADVPELVIARQTQSLLLGAFNFGDEPARRIVDVARLGLRTGVAVDLWDGNAWSIEEGWLDLGEIPPHGGRLVRIA
jgi:alpha-galactosidase